MVLSLLRKGGLDVPLMIVMNHLTGINGITWATPMADFGAMVIAIIIFIPFWKIQKWSVYLQYTAVRQSHSGMESTRSGSTKNLSSIFSKFKLFFW